MKCANCGWLFSPNHPSATCPRCGSPAQAGQQAVADAAPASFPWGGNGQSIPSGAGTPLQQNQWMQGTPVMPPAYLASGLQSPPSQQVGIGQGWQVEMNRPGAPDPQRWQPQRNRPGRGRNSRFGFLIAGLCILAGALLLVFVYFMATSSQGNQNTPGGATQTQTAPSPTVATSPTSTTSPSPTTSTYPGQQYIDNAQMSSSPPPAQLTSTFKTGQKIYVLFTLLPNTQGGVVCLAWYLNGQQITSYNFPVSAHGSSSNTYAFAILGGTGPGYVQLYWANDTTCSNDVLAQQVNFTVTQ